MSDEKKENNGGSYRARNWCFTLNNFTAEERKSLEATVFPPARYLVFQEEKGEAEETPHLQGYIEFTRPFRVAEIKRLPGFARAHLEGRRGTRLQAASYCKKEGGANLFEAGDGPSKRKEHPAKEVVEYLAGHPKVKYHDLCIKFPRAMHYKSSYQAFVSSLLSDVPAFRNVKVDIYVGPTGTGKTRLAVDHPDVYLLTQPEGQVWFDDYRGEKRLVLDEFYGWVKYSYLLRLLDGYKLRLPVKGYHTYAHWTEVIITSNTTWTEWYSVPADQSPLRRRITGVRTFNNDGTSEYSLVE